MNIKEHEMTIDLIKPYKMYNSIIKIPNSAYDIEVDYDSNDNLYNLFIWITNLNKCLCCVETTPECLKSLLDIYISELTGKNHYMVKSDWFLLRNGHKTYDIVNV